jgi:transposase
VVQAWERGSSFQLEVAEFFGVSLSFVEKLLRLHRCNGEFEPIRKRAGRHTLIDAAACEQALRSRTT